MGGQQCCILFFAGSNPVISTNFYLILGNNMNEFYPNYIVSPGQIIFEHMEYKFSIDEFSTIIGLPVQETRDLFHGRLEITEEIAKHLEEFVGELKNTG